MKMDTRLLDEKNEQDIKEAGKILRRGGLVAIPTETVYGLAGNALDPTVSAQIYKVKGRPSDNPLIVHIADIKELPALVEEIPEAAKKLADAFWPGPLTVLLPARASLPQALVNAEGQVAVRVTPHPLAAQLAVEAGGPLTASSANLSGGEAVRSPQQLDPALLDALHHMAQEMPSASSDAHKHNQQPLLLGGPLPAGGLPSTMVEPLGCAKGGAIRLRMVRNGAVSAAELEAAGFTLE